MTARLHPLTPESIAAINRTADAIRDFALLGCALQAPPDEPREIVFGRSRFLYDPTTGLAREIADKPRAS